MVNKKSIHPAHIPPCKIIKFILNTFTFTKTLSDKLHQPPAGCFPAPERDGVRPEKDSFKF
jgi:hypothetical protein